MAREDSGIQMPSSSGGLVKYFSEYETKYEIEPKLVIIVSLVLIVGVMILHFLNPLGL